MGKQSEATPFGGTRFARRSSSHHPRALARAVTDLTRRRASRVAMDDVLGVKSGGLPRGSLMLITDEVGASGGWVVAHLLRRALAEAAAGAELDASTSADARRDVRGSRGVSAAEQNVHTTRRRSGSSDATATRVRRLDHPRRPLRPYRRARHTAATGTPRSNAARRRATTTNPAKRPSATSSARSATTPSVRPPRRRHPPSRSPTPAVVIFDNVAAAATTRVNTTPTPRAPRTLSSPRASPSLTVPSSPSPTPTPRTRADRPADGGPRGSPPPPSRRLTAPRRTHGVVRHAPHGTTHAHEKIFSFDARQSHGRWVAIRETRRGRSPLGDGPIRRAEGQPPGADDPIRERGEDAAPRRGGDEKTAAIASLETFATPNPRST